MKRLLIFIFLISTTSLFAQGELTLDMALSGNVFSATKGAGSVSWLKDGAGYSRKEFNQQMKGYDIVRYEAADNKRSVIVPCSKFIDKKSGEPIDIYSFSWSDDNNKILVFNNTVRVWRYHTKGDYYVVDLLSGDLRKLGEGLPESSLMFAKFNTDGSKVAYVSCNNIYVEDLKSGKITKITDDGSDKIVNGTFDWVYEEEFDCRDGFRWSGDGKYIAYWRSNTEGTGVFNMINNVDSIYSKPIPLPYPKTGTTNSSVKVGYISADGGGTKWIDLPGDPRENYIPRMEFIPGTNSLFIQQMNRHQSVNKVWIEEIGKDNPVNIFTDSDAAWTNPNDDIQWFKDNKYFTWLSDRDGYKHIYLVSQDGKDIQTVTKGDIDIMSVCGTDRKNGYVYYIASPENYTQRYLYRSKFFGDGKMERVTPLEISGTNSYNISPSGRWAVHTSSSSTLPHTTSMVALPNHSTVRVIADNQKIKEEYDVWKFNYKEFVKADIGDFVLDAWMLKPRNFDPTKKYPVILDIYGEPNSTTVNDSWSANPWHLYLADQGYIIMSIDNRGVNAPRGREWRKSIYKQIGIAATDDQAAAITALGKQYSFIDMERIGVTGWSGGGSMTLNCMFRYPEIYKTGVAVAFVSHQKLYNTIYQERFMQTPQENPEGYEYGSPITHAKNLKGSLLIVHGTADDNVHYQSCELLINELVRNQKLFQLQSYPMRSHGISEREGTTEHLRRTMDKFWRENLAAGGR